MSLQRENVKGLGEFYLEKSPIAGTGGNVTLMKVRGKYSLRLMNALTGKREFFKFEVLGDRERKEMLEVVNDKARKMNDESRRDGTGFIPLNDDERDAIIRFRQYKYQCKVAGIVCHSIADLMQQVIEKNNDLSFSPRFLDEWERYMDFKRNQKLSGSHIGGLESKGRRLLDVFGGYRVGDIDSDMVSRFLMTMTTEEGCLVAVDTVLNYRRALHAFFEWMRKRDIVGKNPVVAAHCPKLPPSCPGFFSVGDTRALLDAVARLCPNMVPAFVLGLFCGLRPDSEIIRLMGERVDMDKGTVTIRNEGKRRVGRIVPVPENAMAWLGHVGFVPVKGMPVVPGDTEEIRKAALRRARDRVLKETGIEWVKDGMRHSYATYCYAKDDNVFQLAKHMGHSQGVGTLMTFYANLVTRDDGLEYFGIAPSE